MLRSYRYYFWQNVYQCVGQPTNFFSCTGCSDWTNCRKARVTNLSVFIFSVYCTASHTSRCATAGRLELQWTAHKLRFCWYKKKYILIIFRCCLSYISWSEPSPAIISSLRELLCVPWPFLFIPKKGSVIFHFRTDLLSTVLHWVCFVTEEDRRIGFTEIGL
jgi:hypothetical protein